jgi:hypothetical protein
MMRRASPSRLLRAALWLGAAALAAAAAAALLLPERRAPPGESPDNPAAMRDLKPSEQRVA